MMGNLGVIWDMDGVLVDSGDLHYRAWVAVLPDFGIQFDKEQFRRTFGMNNTGIITMLLGRLPPPELIVEISDRKEHHFRQAARGRVSPLPGVPECLEALAAAGFRQAFASSAPMANINTLVNELDIGPFFDAVVSGFELPGKPDPATFLAAAQAIDVLPGDAIVVEDAVAGVEGARRAGMKCIAVTTTNPAESLRDANMVVTSLEGLTPALFIQLLSEGQ
jgi:HAD superfamily hydrolase (TIGR01509 family)